MRVEKKPHHINCNKFIWSPATWALVFCIFLAFQKLLINYLTCNEIFKMQQFSSNFQIALGVFIMNLGRDFLEGRMEYGRVFYNKMVQTVEAEFPAVWGLGFQFILLWLVAGYLFASADGPGASSEKSHVPFTAVVYIWQVYRGRGGRSSWSKKQGDPAYRDWL